MRSRMSAVLCSLGLIFGVTELQAAPVFVSVFNFSWSGSLGTAGIWGITASSEFIDPFPDDDPRFDQVNVNVSIEGRVDIVGTPGSSFTRENVIALDLTVNANGYRLADYSLLKDNLRIGVMSGTIVDTIGAITAELSAFRLMQRVDTTDPLQKFEQIFGCPTINDDCGSGAYLTPLPAYESGNPVPPGPGPYGVVVLTDGRSDPCCGARSNALRFFYDSVDAALASYRLTLDRDASYLLDGPLPEGLPEGTPLPLPGTASLLLAGGLLLLRSARRGRAQRVFA